MTPHQLFLLIRYIAVSSGCRVIVTSRISDDCDGNVSFETKSLGRPVIRLRKKIISNENVGEVGEIDWILMSTVLMHELGHVNQHVKCAKCILDIEKHKKKKRIDKRCLKLTPYLYHLFGLVPNTPKSNKVIDSPEWRLKMIELTEIDASRYAFNELKRLLMQVIEDHELMYEIYDRMQSYYDTDQVLSELDPAAVKEWLRDAWIESYKLEK